MYQRTTAAKAPIDVQINRMYTAELSVSRPLSCLAFVGKPETAPSEPPVLTGRTREELARDYGEPIGSSPISQGCKYPYFRNGVVAPMRDGKTYEYGVSRRAK